MWILKCKNDLNIYPACSASLKVRSHQTRMKHYVRMIYMLSQCKDAIDNPAALFERMRWREWCELRATNWAFGAFDTPSRELKNLNFGRYSHRVNQSGACSSMITSGGRKSETTMEDNVIVVVCRYLELYDTTLYFYKNRNTFCNETGAACRSPSHDATSRLLCSEFHARMARISRFCLQHSCIKFKLLLIIKKN